MRSRRPLPTFYGAVMGPDDCLKCGGRGFVETMRSQGRCFQCGGTGRSDNTPRKRARYSRKRFG